MKGTKMERVKESYLKSLVKEINELENRPVESYSEKIDNLGRKSYRANIGNLHLECRSSCYGAYSKTVLVMSNEAGGVSYFFGGQEYYKPSELKMKLEAYLQAIRK
jgi:hypothetical protein